MKNTNMNLPANCSLLTDDEMMNIDGAFVGAFLLNELISRVPILRWCVLGIGKEKNHVSR